MFSFNVTQCISGSITHNMELLAVIVGQISPPRLNAPATCFRVWKTQIYYSRHATFYVTLFCCLFDSNFHNYNGTLKLYLKGFVLSTICGNFKTNNSLLGKLSSNKLSRNFNCLFISSSVSV